MKHTFRRAKEGLSATRLMRRLNGILVCLAIVAMLTFVYAGFVPVKAQLTAQPTARLAAQPKAQATWQTSLVLADQTPDLLTAHQSDIVIAKGPSRYDEEQARLAAQAAAKAAAQAAAKARQQVSVVSDVGYDQKVALAQRAAATYGIPTNLLLAVWQIESGMRWETSIENELSGAGGPFQFIQGTWRAYAVDGNGDGQKNRNQAEDAAFAAAKLLAVNGANQGDYRRALLRYNHADWYVNRVLAMAGM